MTHTAGGSQGGQESGECGYYHLRHELYDVVLLHRCLLMFLRVKLFVDYVVSQLVEAASAFDCRIAGCGATFLSGHCFDEQRPLPLCEALHPAQAGPAADVADVPFRIVFGGRCPASDDVLHTDGVVPLGVSAEDTAGCPDAPLHGDEADERPLLPSP